jgi:hypothetical protein
MAAVFLFDEIIFDPTVIMASEGSPPASGAPAFANTMSGNEGTGNRKVNVNRYDARELITVDVNMLDESDLAYLLKMWRGGYGNAVGFRFQVPYDYYVEGQVLGTIAASTTASFNLVKTYTRPNVTARQDSRRIIKPVVNTNLASLGGLGGSVTLLEPQSGSNRVIEVPFAVTVGGAGTGFTYTINNTTGVLSVTTTTANGTVAATFQFDTPMRFIDNVLPITRRDVSSEVKGVQFEEILPFELNIT